MGSPKTCFLYNRVMFHFHDYGRKGKLSKHLRLILIRTKMASLAPTSSGRGGTLGVSWPAIVIEFQQRKDKATADLDAVFEPATRWAQSTSSIAFWTSFLSRIIKGKAPCLKWILSWVVVSNIFYVHPEIRGRFSFWLIFFEGAGSTTN